MAENTIKVRQKQRYDTEANWTSKNPVLLAGEIAISSDKNGLMKVGDGKSLWTAIPYSKASLSKTDVTTALGYTPPTTNTTYSIGTSSTAGIVKLYTGTGSNTDGSMTQAAIKSALDGKSGTGHTHSQYYDSTISRTANTVLAAPNGSDGGATFRKLVAADIPSHGTHIPDTCKTIDDWNNATTNGWYMSSTATNAPTSETWYYGIVIAHNTSYLRQILFHFSSSNNVTSETRYERIRQNGTWGSWTNTTVGTPVPTGAKFTDTNTWRGIQNNLTSDSTSDSLSAAQGKALNTAISTLSNNSFQKKDTLITNTTDWNTIKTPGCYKVQVATWGDASKVHSPNEYYNGLYQYGLLLVFKASDSDTEARTVQIFLPHASNRGNPVLTRMFNGSTWNAWCTIGRGIKWSEIIEKPSTFTPASHTHDDRYYTETEIDTKLKTKSDTGHTHDINTLINALDTGTATPTDNDYYVCQWAGGGSGNMTYVRRSTSSLWNYIKTKTDATYLPLTGGTVTGVTSFTNTTASTSTTTGAVKVSGGVGISGRMSANEVGIGSGAVIKYDSTNKCINFVFS